MYAVIFKAKIKQIDSHYTKTAKRMRELAFEQYGCIDFMSVCEDDMEITISYWDSKDTIKAWKQDSEHLVAQKNGQEKWYESYQVEIVKIEREYSITNDR